MNRNLIGETGARNRLETRALLIDLDALEENLAKAAAWASSRGIALRPHAKTHKSVEIARRQVAAGAVGICVATAREAAALAAGGIEDLLLTTPVAPGKLPHLVALAKKCRLRVVADDPEYVSALADAAGAANMEIAVLVDLDTGLNRTGVAGVEDAVALARQIDTAGPLRYDGLQAYYGHLQHVEAYDDRRRDVESEAVLIRAAVGALTEAGLQPRLVTGGGTGTHEIDAELGLFTDLQLGSYVFGDVEYESVRLRKAETMPFRTALFVRTSVVSRRGADMVATDAGLKAFATDGPMPRVHSGGPKDAVYDFTGDEHGSVAFPGAGALPLGAAFECVVPHCDPTVNLYADYHIVRGEELVNIWPVDGRGAA